MWVVIHATITEPAHSQRLKAAAELEAQYEKHNDRWGRSPFNPDAGDVRANCVQVAHRLVKLWCEQSDFNLESLREQARETYA